eukprot:754575-Hanusia_phi.AAC.2
MHQADKTADIPTALSAAALEHNAHGSKRSNEAGDGDEVLGCSEEVSALGLLHVGGVVAGPEQGEEGQEDFHQQPHPPMVVALVREEVRGGDSHPEAVEHHHKGVADQKAVEGGEAGVDEVGQVRQVAEVSCVVLPCDPPDHRVGAQILRNGSNQRHYLHGEEREVERRRGLEDNLARSR